MAILWKSFCIFAIAQAFVTEKRIFAQATVVIQRTSKIIRIAFIHISCMPRINRRKVWRYSESHIVRIFVVNNIAV